MSTRTLSVAVVWFIFPVAVALGQQTPSASPVPAATQSQVDCTGFITSSNVSTDIMVNDGADNDFQAPVRELRDGDFVYLHSSGNTKFSVGDQFSIVRRAKELFRTARYSSDHWAIRSLGKPYEDAGRVQVAHVTPEGAVAEVRFTCGPIYPGDIALPYQPRPIPNYVPAQLDRFALPNGKMQGTIVAARNNYGALKHGDIVYLNLGQEKGAQIGQMYRVFFRIVAPAHWPVLGHAPNPRETVGEIVVLSAQEKSSAAIIVDSTRDIDVGYGVELE